MAQIITNPSETMTGRVFSALSPMHQSLLWNVDVEQRPLSEVTKIMDLVPKEVVVQLSTARLRFYTDWAKMQSHNPRLRTDCQRISYLLRAYAEFRLNPIERKQVQGHLKVCFRCAMLVQEAGFLASHLRIALRPLQAPGVTPEPNKSPSS